MSSPIIFRPLGHHTLEPVTIERAPLLIRELRSFLTAPRLAAALATYRMRVEKDHDIRVIRMQDSQPLIEGFIQFDRMTFQGRRKLKRLTPEIAALANIAAMLQFVIPSFDSATRTQHIDRLLSLNGQLRPLLLEWKTAAHVARNKGAQLAWLPSKGKSLPEFIARVDGVEFDLECKRPTPMVTQRLGDTEADEVAAAIMRGARERDLQGRLTLDVTNDVITEKGGLRDDIAKPLLEHLKAGAVDTKLPSGVHLSGALAPQTTRWFDRDLWLASVGYFQRQVANARVYSNAEANGEQVGNAVTLRLIAPIKSPDELAKDLWELKFKKAASQCTGERGAILVFEWESVTDPTIFADTHIFQQMAASTFTEFPHVSRIVMRCDSEPESEGGLIHFDVKVYTVENVQARFPEVCRFMRIEAPL